MGAVKFFPRRLHTAFSRFAGPESLRSLLIIPGGAFSARDTHVRISYAASDETLQRGIEILRKLAKG